MKNESNVSPLYRILTLILGAGFLLLVFFGYYHEISAITQDLGRHLLTGELIWQSKEVPKINLYSYTYPDFPFINHHYLSEVIFYLIHSLAGFSGLLIFTTFLMVVSLSLLFIFTAKRLSFIPVSITALLYLRILFERTDLRPEIFSYFFLTLFVIILFQFRERFTKWIYVIPLLQLLWVNSHIYFPIGLLLLALFSFDYVLHHKQLKSKEMRTLILVSLLSGLALFINPNGAAGALYPLRVFQNYGYTIEENQTLFFLESLGFMKPSFIYFKISVFLLFTTLLLTFKKTRPIDWLLSVTFTIIAFMAVRNFPLFVIATFIPFARSLETMYNWLLSQVKNSYNQVLPLSLLIIVLVLLIFQLFTVKNLHTFGATLPQGASKGVTFFQENSLTGPLFNNFDIGSYLSYRLYPKEKVFIDGRPEAYPSSFIQEVYIPMQEDPQQFATIEKQYNFTTIFFSHTDQTPWAKQFLQHIVVNDSWKIVYLDPAVIILVKDIPQNAAIISKYAMNKDELQMENMKEDLPTFYRAALFFQNIGQKDKEQFYYRKMLELDPQNCGILTQLILSEEQQNPLTLQRYNLYCQ